MTSMIKFERMIIKKAKELGFQDVRIERTRDHPALVATFDGRHVKYVFTSRSSSPGIERTTIAGLRRLMASPEDCFMNGRRKKTP